MSPSVYDEYVRKSHKGLDSRRLTSLSLATLAPDYLAMECLRHRREDLEVRKKNMAHLTDTLYTRAPVSPRTATPCSSLDPCKPLTCSNRAQSSFLIQHTQGQLLHPRQSHKPAPSRSSGPAAVCFVNWKSGHYLSLGFSLLPLSSSAVPSGPHTAAWRRCACNLLFSCRWLGLGLWLLGLRLWRDEKLDLLGADGDFIRLKPPFEMFQGALIRIKSIHKKL